MGLGLLWLTHYIYIWQPYSCLRNHYVAQPLKRLLNMLATSSLRHWRWIWSGLWTCGSWASSWWKVRLWRGCTPCGTRTAFNEKKESVQWIDVFFLIQHLFTQKKSCCQKMMDKNKWMDQVCKYNVGTWNECPILFLSPFHGATDENEFFKYRWLILA